jgi:hypothetical protein
VVLPLVPVMPVIRSCEEGQLKKRSAIRPTKLFKFGIAAPNTAGGSVGGPKSA